MEIKKTLKVNAAQFYHFLLYTIASEYEVNTGKSIELTDIKAGLTYSKMLRNSKTVDTESTIVRLDENRNYTVKIKNPRGTVVMSYTLEEEDDHMVTVTYTEKIPTENNGEKKLGFMEKIQLSQGMKQRQKRLKQIEEYILKTPEYEGL